MANSRGRGGRFVGRHHCRLGKSRIPLTRPAPQGLCGGDRREARWRSPPLAQRTDTPTGRRCLYRIRAAGLPPRDPRAGPGHERASRAGQISGRPRVSSPHHSLESGNNAGRRIIARRRAPRGRGEFVSHGIRGPGLHAAEPVVRRVHDLEQLRVGARRVPQGREAAHAPALRGH